MVETKSIVGVLLAGGLARRMGGGDKSLRSLAGMPILGHVLARVRPQVGPLLLNVIVLSDQDNMRAAALNLMRFFEYESCGQCTPCRAGTEKAVKLMSSQEWDQPLLQELSKTMMDASICGLGQAAPNPLLMVLKHFPEDLTEETK